MYLIVNNTFFVLRVHALIGEGVTGFPKGRTVIYHKTPSRESYHGYHWEGPMPE